MIAQLARRPFGVVVIVTGERSGITFEVLAQHRLRMTFATCDGER